MLKVSYHAANARVLETALEEEADLCFAGSVLLCCKDREQDAIILGLIDVLEGRLYRRGGQLAGLEHGADFYLSPMLIEQFVVSVSTAVAGIVQVALLIEMVDDGVRLRRGATPSEDFRAHLGGTMLGAGAVGLSAGGQFLQRVFAVCHKSRF